jgi:hypothetical protein
LAFLIVAVYQWLDPFNHRYSGNIALLSITPGVIGLIALIAAASAFKYTVTLRPNEIVVCELLSEKSYPLKNIMRTEKFDNKVTLHFSDGRRLNLYKDLSGYEHFIASLER